MKLISQSVHKRIFDTITTPSELNKLADEFGREGYKVERGPIGSVILTLDDGEIHYIPTKVGIEEFIYQFPKEQIRSEQ